MSVLRDHPTLNGVPEPGDDAALWAGLEAWGGVEVAAAGAATGAGSTTADGAGADGAGVGIDSGSTLG